LREILGYFLIAQAILTGVLVYSIHQLGDAITAASANITTGVSLAWGGGLSPVIIVLLLLVFGIGIYLVLNRKS
jgi:hypothetical protein